MMSNLDAMRPARALARARSRLRVIAGPAFAQDLRRAAALRRARRQRGAAARRRAAAGARPSSSISRPRTASSASPAATSSPSSPGRGTSATCRQHLCAPRRLRRGARAAARSRRAGRRERGARLHLRPARGSPLVRRAAVHERGFPLLLGGRRAQQGAQPGRGAGIHARRRQAPAGRGARRAHDPLQLGQAEPALPADAARSRAIRSSTARRTI